jgi:hypothetical protein
MGFGKARLHYEASDVLQKYTPTVVKKKRVYVYPKDDGRVIAKNTALTKPLAVGTTYLGNPTRKMPEQSHKHKKRGKFWDQYEYALQALVDFIKNKHYDGDAVRLSTKRGLFSNDCMHSTERFMKKNHPEVLEEYEKRYPRKLTGALLVRRIAFLFDSYTVKNGKRVKISGARSKEHPNIITGIE